MENKSCGSVCLSENEATKKETEKIIDRLFDLFRKDSAGKIVAPKTEPSEIWDFIEAEKGKRIRKPSMKLWNCDESFWFQGAYDLMTAVARFHKKSLTAWKELYGFSINFIEVSSDKGKVTDDGRS